MPICRGFTREQYQEYLKTDRKLFHWAYTWALRERKRQMLAAIEALIPGMPAPLNMQRV